MGSLGEVDSGNVDTVSADAHPSNTNETQDHDPLGVRCGAPITEPLDADWIFTDGTPSGIDVGPTPGVEKIAFELRLFDGTSIEVVNLLYDAEENGSFEHSLADSVSVELLSRIENSSAPFGFVAADVFGEDSEGRVVAAAALDQLMLDVEDGQVTVLTPGDASNAYSGQDPAYPALAGENSMALTSENSEDVFHIALVVDASGAIDSGIQEQE